jgi:hypothetical protein
VGKKHARIQWNPVETIPLMLSQNTQCSVAMLLVGYRQNMHYCEQNFCMGMCVYLVIRM